MPATPATLRADYRRPVFAVAVSIAAVAVPLLSGLLPERFVLPAASALIAQVVLMLALLIAAALSFIRLTPEGFSEPVHIMRVFHKWSEVSSFQVVDKRVLGVRIRGVGFNYVRLYPVREKRRRLLDYDRVIAASYGEPSALAHLFNSWREESINRNGGHQV